MEGRTRDGGLEERDMAVDTGGCLYRGGYT